MILGGLSLLFSEIVNVNLFKLILEKLKNIVLLIILQFCCCGTYEMKFTFWSLFHFCYKTISEDRSEK